MSNDLSKNPEQWPPSARQVLRQISGAGPMTNKDLVERTGLARRTLGRTLHRMVAAGLLKRRASLQDTRRYYYFLDDAPKGP